VKADIKIAEDVREVLNRSTVSGTVLFLPPGQLDRKLYTRVNEALEALGGKWSRGKKGHVFDADPRPAINGATETGKVVHPNPHDFFWTSRDVAEMACHRLGMNSGWLRTLEPSAGNGDLFAPLVDWWGKPGPGSLTLFDKDPKRCATLREKGYGAHLMQGDFLEMRPEAFLLFDRILMNPPFERGKDEAHVDHALNFLAPGGRLVAIASGAFGARTTNTSRALRANIETWGGVIEDLPEGSFKHAGTNVATVMVVVDRPKAGA
jgi:hypothetical protein